MTLKLWNPTNTWWWCNLPWNSFDLRMRTVMTEAIPTMLETHPWFCCFPYSKVAKLCSWSKTLEDFPQVGRGPLKLLLRRIKSLRETMEFFKHGGMKPLKRLLDKSKNPLVLQIQWGSGPWNEFEFRSNASISVWFSIESVNLHKQAGTWPSKLLSPGLRSWRLTNFDMDLGIGPLKLFSQRLISPRLRNLDMDSGTKPMNMLLARDRISSVGDDDVFTNSIGPMNWLSSKLTTCNEGIVNKHLGKNPRMSLLLSLTIV